MKIVIFGANNRGCLIATALFEDHDVIIIDRQENIGEDLNKLDIEVIPGNAADVNVLREISPESVDVFIACSDSDEANIFSCMAVKAVSYAKTVCFISNEDYSLSLSAIKTSKFNREIFVDYVIRSEELLTQELFRIITVPNATDVENFARGKARLLEYPVNGNSTLLNKKIKQCAFPDETLIVAITRDGKLFIPDGDTELLLNDRVIFMGAVKSLDDLAADVFKDVNKVRSAVIIGGGAVGLILSERLERAGISCKIIEKDYKRCEYISSVLRKSLVIHGDGTDIKLLAAEEIENADVAVSVTDNDEKNLLCSLLAKQAGVPKVISRVSKEPNVLLFEKVGIDVAVSPNDAALSEIYNRLIETDVSILATVERGQAEVIEVLLPRSFSKRLVMDLKLPHKAIIAIIERGDKVIIPKGSNEILPCDNLLVFTAEETSSEIKKFLLNC